MTYRDDSAALKERIDQLELALAKSTGTIHFLTDQRDQLRAELKRLAGDPKELQRLRGRKQGRRALYMLMRIVGGGIVAMFLAIGTVFGFAMGAQEAWMALACLAPVLLLFVGVLLLKLPEIIEWMERRAVRDSDKKQMQTVQARVELPPAEVHEIEASAPVEAANTKRA